MTTPLCHSAAQPKAGFCGSLNGGYPSSILRVKTSTEGFAICGEEKVGSGRMRRSRATRSLPHPTRFPPRWPCATPGQTTRRPISTLQRSRTPRLHARREILIPHSPQGPQAIFTLGTCDLRRSQVLSLYRTPFSNRLLFARRMTRCHSKLPRFLRLSDLFSQQPWAEYLM